MAFNAASPVNAIRATLNDPNLDYRVEDDGRIVITDKRNGQVLGLNLEQANYNGPGGTVNLIRSQAGKSRKIIDPTITANLDRGTQKVALEGRTSTQNLIAMISASKHMASQKDMPWNQAFQLILNAGNQELGFQPARTEPRNTYEEIRARSYQSVRIQYNVHGKGADQSKGVVQPFKAEMKHIDTVIAREISKGGDDRYVPGAEPNDKTGQGGMTYGALNKFQMFPTEQGTLEPSSIRLTGNLREDGTWQTTRAAAKYPKAPHIGGGSDKALPLRVVRDEQGKIQDVVPMAPGVTTNASSPNWALSNVLGLGERQAQAFEARSVVIGKSLIPGGAFAYEKESEVAPDLWGREATATIGFKGIRPADIASGKAEIQLDDFLNKEYGEGRKPVTTIGTMKVGDNTENIKMRLGGATGFIPRNITMHMPKWVDADGNPVSDYVEGKGYESTEAYAKQAEERYGIKVDRHSGTGFGFKVGGWMYSDTSMKGLGVKTSDIPTGIGATIKKQGMEFQVSRFLGDIKEMPSFLQNSVMGGMNQRQLIQYFQDFGKRGGEAERKLAQTFEARYGGEQDGPLDVDMDRLASEYSELTGGKWEGEGKMLAVEMYQKNIYDQRNNARQNKRNLRLFGMGGVGGTRMPVSMWSPDNLSVVRSMFERNALAANPKATQREIGESFLQTLRPTSRNRGVNARFRKAAMGQGEFDFTELEQKLDPDDMIFDRALVHRRIEYAHRAKANLEFRSGLTSVAPNLAKSLGLSSDTMLAETPQQRAALGGIRAVSYQTEHMRAPEETQGPAEGVTDINEDQLSAIQGYIASSKGMPKNEIMKGVVERYGGGEDESQVWRLPGGAYIQSPQSAARMDFNELGIDAAQVGSSWMTSIKRAQELTANDELRSSMTDEQYGEAMNKAINPSTNLIRKLITGTGEYFKRTFSAENPALIGGKYSTGTWLQAGETFMPDALLKSVARRTRTGLRGFNEMLRKGFDTFSTRFPQVTSHALFSSKVLSRLTSARRLGYDRAVKIAQNPLWRMSSHESLAFQIAHIGDSDKDPKLAAANLQNIKGQLRVGETTEEIRAGRLTNEKAFALEKQYIANQSFRDDTNAFFGQVGDAKNKTNIFGKLFKGLARYAPEELLAAGYQKKYNKQNVMPSGYNIRNATIAYAAASGRSEQEVQDTQKINQMAYGPGLDMKVKFNLGDADYSTGVPAAQVISGSYIRMNEKEGRPELFIAGGGMHNRQHRVMEDGRTLPPQQGGGAAFDLANLMSSPGEAVKALSFVAEQFAKGVPGMDGETPKLSAEQMAPYFSFPGGNEELTERLKGVESTQYGAEVIKYVGEKTAGLDKKEKVRAIMSLTGMGAMMTNVIGKVFNNESETGEQAIAGGVEGAGVIREQQPDLYSTYLAASSGAQFLKKEKFGNLSTFTPTFLRKALEHFDSSTTFGKTFRKVAKFFLRGAPGGNQAPVKAQPIDIQSLSQTAGNPTDLSTTHTKVDGVWMEKAAAAALQDPGLLKQRSTLGQPTAGDDGSGFNVDMSKVQEIDPRRAPPVPQSDLALINKEGKEFSARTGQEIVPPAPDAPTPSQPTSVTPATTPPNTIGKLVTANERVRIDTVNRWKRLGGSGSPEQIAAISIEKLNEEIQQMVARLPQTPTKEVGGTNAADFLDEKLERQRVIGDALSGKEPAEAIVASGSPPNKPPRNRPPAPPTPPDDDGKRRDPSDPRRGSQDASLAAFRYPKSVSDKIIGNYQRIKGMEAQGLNATAYVSKILDDMGIPTLTGEGQNMHMTSRINMAVKQDYAGFIGRVGENQDMLNIIKGQAQNATDINFAMATKDGAPGISDEIHEAYEGWSRGEGIGGRDAQNLRTMKYAIGKNEFKSVRNVRRADRIERSPEFSKVYAAMQSKGLLGDNVDIDQWKDFAAENPKAVEFVTQAQKLVGSEKSPLVPAKMQELAGLGKHLTSVDKDALKPDAAWFRVPQGELEKFNKSLSEMQGHLVKLNEASGSVSKTEKERTQILNDYQKSAIGVRAQAARIEGIGIQKRIDDFQAQQGEKPMRGEQWKKFQSLLGEQVQNATEYERANNEYLQMQEDKGMGGFARKMLGGFGLMYLKSIGGLATSGLGYGQQERAGLDQGNMAMGAQVFGTRDVMRNQQLQLSNAMALSGGNYSALAGGQMFGAKNPWAREVGSGVVSGISAWGLASYVGKELGASGVGLKGAAPAIGVAIGVGSLLAGGYERAQDQNSLAFRYGQGAPSIMDSVAGAMFTDRGRVEDRSLGGVGFLGRASGYAPGSDFDKLQRNSEFYSRLKQDVKRGGVSFDEMQRNYGKSNSEMFGALTTTYMGAEGGDKFAPEAHQRAAAIFARSSGLKPSVALEQKLAGDFMNQIGTDQLAGKGLSALGLSQYAQLAQGKDKQSLVDIATVGMVAGGEMTDIERGLFTAGSEFAAQTPGIRKLRSTQKAIAAARTGDTSRMETLMNKYAALQGTAAGEVYQSQAGAYELAEMAGVKYQQPDVNSFLTPGGSAIKLTPQMAAQQTAEAQGIAYQASNRLQMGQNAMNQSYQFGNYDLGKASRNMMMNAPVGQEWFYNRVNNLDPMTMAVASNRGGMNLSAMPGISTMNGTQLNAVMAAFTDTNLQGQVTGLPWGTTSFNMGGQSMANNMFGANWQSNKNFNTDAIRAGVQGYKLPGSITVPGQSTTTNVGGMMGMQLYSSEMAMKQQLAQVGIQNKGWQLDWDFQHEMWGIEDKQRDLSHKNTMWSFDFQNRGIQQNVTQFKENTNLDRYSSMKQRSWAREDWGYQDMTRNMQWGWKQEDFQEEARFMTGRQRKLAERGNKRETIMHNLEGDQIDKGRGRQEELWKLEDERFKLQVKHFNQGVEMQKEQLKHSKEYYEQNKKLEDQKIKLSRKHWEDEMLLNKESAKLAAANAVAQHKLNVTMAQAQNATELFKGALATATDDGMERLKQSAIESLPIFQKIADELDRISGVNTAPIIAMANSTMSSGSGLYSQYGSPTTTTTSGSKPPTRRKAGGGVLSGDVEVVGEQGWEFIIGDTVIPHEISKQLEYAGLRPGSSRAEGKDKLASMFSQAAASSRNDKKGSAADWSYVPMQPAAASSSQPQTINVYVGNDKLASFVVDTVSKELRV